MCSESVPQRSTTALRYGVRSDAGNAKLVIYISIFLWSEEEVDATVRPVHVAGTVLEFLFPVDPLLKLSKKSI